MKKIALVVVLFALTMGVYAQSRVSLDMHYTLFGELEGPGFSLGIDLGKLDFLTSFDFWVERDSDNITDDVIINFWHGMYVGIAPKAAISEKVSLSFPIFLKFYRHSEIIKRDNPEGKEKIGQNHLRLDAGARAYYAVSKKWSIYTGFQMNLIEIAGANKTRRSGSFGSGSSDDGAFGLYSLKSGSLDFGVKFSI
ncbi:MAG: hypothetical protein FWH35_03950 [Treponema sp.]|nr:hypothetical protein [Treponema sp.]